MLGGAVVILGRNLRDVIVRLCHIGRDIVLNLFSQHGLFTGRDVGRVGVEIRLDLMPRLGDLRDQLAAILARMHQDLRLVGAIDLEITRHVADHQG